MSGVGADIVVLVDLIYGLWRALLRVLFWVFVVAFLLILFGTATYGLGAALAEDSVDRRLAALADVFAAGGFLLAVLAVVVAILAYSQSIRRPNLGIAIGVGDDEAGWAVSVIPDLSGNYREIATNADSQLYVTLVSRNNVSARNPAVKVTIQAGLAYLYSGGGNWVLIDEGPRGAGSAQWDGGADYIVHGGWKRELPALPLGGSRLSENDAEAVSLQVQWVADGVRQQSWTIVIELNH